MTKLYKFLVLLSFQQIIKRKFNCKTPFCVLSLVSGIFCKLVVPFSSSQCHYPPQFFYHVLLEAFLVLPLQQWYSNSSLTLHTVYEQTDFESIWNYLEHLKLQWLYIPLQNFKYCDMDIDMCIYRVCWG